MGIGDSGILAVGKRSEETTKELIANLVDEDSELISIYYGEEVSEEEAEKFAGEIEELYPDVDVDIQFGGQPIYYYVLCCRVRDKNEQNLFSYRTDMYPNIRSEKALVYRVRFFCIMNRMSFVMKRLEL